MCVLKFPSGHWWQQSSFETGLPILFRGNDGGQTRHLCQETFTSINSTIRLRQCPSLDVVRVGVFLLYFTQSDRLRRRERESECVQEHRSSYLRVIPLLI